MVLLSDLLFALEELTVALSHREHSVLTLPQELLYRQNLFEYFFIQKFPIYLLLRIQRIRGGCCMLVLHDLRVKLNHLS